VLIEDAGLPWWDDLVVGDDLTGDRVDDLDAGTDAVDLHA
jgi:hypothetical protein